MATTGGTGAAGAAGAGAGAAGTGTGNGGNGDGGYAGLTAPRQEKASQMTQRKSDAVWQVVYGAAGARTERERRVLRLATYKAFCVNGTSREGEYNWNVVDASGRSYPASVLVGATGKFDIRKFFRANMRDSYEALKTTETLLDEEEYVARVEGLNIPRENVHATADWLTNCPLFSPAEARAHEVARAAGFGRAEKARRGVSLEEAEERRAMAAVLGEAEHERSGSGVEGTLVPGRRPVW